MSTQLLSILAEYDQWVRLVHIAGAIIAVGAVFATDVLLLWLKARPTEALLVARVSPLLSLQVWIGFTLLAVSGLLLFLPMQGLAGTSFFQLKMFLVLVVFVNGLVLQVAVLPRFEQLVPEWSSQTKRVKNFVTVAGISAAVSFIGWWSLIILIFTK